MSTLLKGMSFNLQVGRDIREVRREVRDLIDHYGLHFAAFQEAADYYMVLEEFGGDNWNYWTGIGPRWNKNTGILTHKSLKVDIPRPFWYGDGWTTVGGKHSHGSAQMRIRINNRLIIRDVHLPTPTNWVNGKLEAPPERRDDYIAGAKAIRTFLRRPDRIARVAVGDWNESPYTSGEYSPVWMRKGSGAKFAVPTSTKGHGRIDWLAYKNCTVPFCFKDEKITEGSDHEPVIFGLVV